MCVRVVSVLLFLFRTRFWPFRAAPFPFLPTRARVVETTCSETYFVIVQWSSAATMRKFPADRCPTPPPPPPPKLHSLPNPPYDGIPSRSLPPFPRSPPPPPDDGIPSRPTTVSSRCRHHSLAISCHASKLSIGTRIPHRVGADSRKKPLVRQKRSTLHRSIAG